MIFIDWTSTILHQEIPEFVSPFPPEKGKAIEISLKVYKTNPIQEIYIDTPIDGEGYHLLMENKYDDEFYSIYKVRVQVQSNKFHYKFRLITASTQLWFNTQGICNVQPLDIYDFKLLIDFRIPDWLNSSIFYQIFPDRFYDGDPSNNVQTGEYSREGDITNSYNWNQPPIPKKGMNPSNIFYGGDLEGIKRKIPYLKKLGINAIYLNPIFHSLSNHKYDTADYRKIDPHFGSNEDFHIMLMDGELIVQIG